MWTVQRVPWSADGVSPLAPTVKQSMLNYLSEGDDWLPLGIHDKMSLMSKGTGTCEHHGHGLWRIPTPVIDMLQIAGAVVKDVFMYSLSTGHSPKAYRIDDCCRISPCLGRYAVWFETCCVLSLLFKSSPIPHIFEGGIHIVFEASAELPQVSSNAPKRGVVLAVWQEPAREV